MAKEMENILMFDCKYADRVEKGTHKAVVYYIFKLRATMAFVTEREKRLSIYTGKRV